jgi:hypothetical protein
MGPPVPSAYEILCESLFKKTAKEISELIDVRR